MNYQPIIPEETTPVISHEVGSLFSRYSYNGSFAFFTALGCRDFTDVPTRRQLANKASVQKTIAVCGFDQHS